MESINKLFENHSPQPNKPVKAGDAKASSTDVSITVTEQSATCYLTETKPRSTDDCIVRGDKVPEVTSTAETDHFKDGLVPYATTQAKDKVSNQKESTEPIVIKDKSPKPLASEPTTTTTTKAESTEAAQADAVSQESELHISEATKALIAMVEATDFRAVLTPGPEDFPATASDSYSTTSTDQPNETDSPIVSNVETLDAEVIDTDGIDHNTDMPVESEIAPTSFTMVDTEMTRVQQNALVASINAGLAPGEHISRDDVAQLSGDGESTVNDLSGIQNYRNCPEWARHVTVGSEFWDVQITADYYFNKMSEQPESSIDTCSPLELLTDWDSEETGTPADSTQTAETGADTPTNSDSPALIEDFSELAIEKLLSSSIAGHYMTDAEWYASMQAPGTAEDVSKVYCTEFNSGGEVVDLEDDQENSVIIHPLNDAATEVFDSTSDNHDVDEEDLVIPKEAFISEAKVVETADLTASEPILYYTAKDSDPLPEQPSLGFFFVPKEQKTLDVCEKETAISTKQDELAVIEPVVSTEETQKDVEDPSDLEVFIAALHMIDITPDNSTDISTTAVSPVAPIDTDALFESTPAAALADAATIEHTSVGTDVLPTDNLQQVSVQLDNPIPANASISVSTSLLEFPGTSVVAHNSNLSTLSGLEVENDENNAPSVDIAAASLTTETVCLHPAAALQPQIPETAQPHIPSAPIANNDISSTLETNEAISISFNTANTNSLNIAPTTHVSNMATSLVVKKLSDKAKLPVRGSAFAAGYDLAAAEEIVIPAHGKALVSTGLSMAIPDGTYGRIAPRSGLAAKHFIDTGAGVIDADYRGEVKVLLFNHNDSDFSIAEGDRVAQLILERIYTPEVFEVTELPESVRGAGGFGSTGGFGTTI